MSDITDVMARDIEESERKERAERENSRRYSPEIDSRTEWIFVSVGIVLTLAFFAWLAYMELTSNVRERAAYNEGYYGVCHDEAVAMAKAGIGKTDMEVLQ